MEGVIALYCIDALLCETIKDGIVVFSIDALSWVNSENESVNT